MADIFEIVGRISLDGLNDAERDLNNLSGAGEQSASKLSKLGGIAKTVGKGVLVATGAVVTGAVGLVKQVSSSYGELQQSIGGIETLFGDSAQKVIENANNAYTTAGISANEYMQQVTSFSASLLQSLGGDTEKAANAADMAVRDMADNANKMGTSMESIQNAYQGFSKQNYTMLDNLKLGYGGTKSEMERLLKDAEKISGVKYDISNLNDVYSAIHVIQQELGITGTTALEAGETIEGSFNSLSASWENFIAGLGNPDADMKQIVDNLAKGLSGAINNVIPVINNMVSVLPTVMDAIIGAVNDLAPTFIETFTTLITQVIDGIVKLLPTIIPLVIDTLESVINALVSNLPQIIDAVILLVTEVIKALSDMLPELIPAVVQAIIDISNSLIENLPTILDAVLQLVLGVADGLIQALPIIIDALPQIIDGIVQFLITATPQIVNASIQLFMAIVEAFPQISQAVVSNLPQIILGIVDGLLNLKTTIFDCAVNLFMALLDGLKTIITNTVEYIPKFIEAVVNVVQQLPGKLQNYWNNIIDKTKSFFSDFISKASEGAKGFVDKIKEFISALPEKMGYWLDFVLGKVAKFVTEFPAKAKEAGQNFVNSLINFIKNLPDKIHNLLTTIVTKVAEWGSNLATTGKNGATKLWNSIVDTLKNLPDKMLNLGKNLVEGIWNGITNAKDWLKEKISGFAGGVVDGFKDALGIHSPSRVMKEEVGKPIADGVGEGISENMEYVMQGLDEELEDMLKGAKQQYDRLLELYESGKITRSEYESIYNSILEENSDVRIQLAEYEAEKISAYNKQVENERKSALRERLSDAKDTFNELFELYEDEKITKENFESEYAVIVKKYGDVRVDLEKYTQDKISDYEDKKQKERRKATETAIKELTSNFESKISGIKSKVDGFAGKVSKSFNGMFNFTTNKDIYDNGLEKYEKQLENLNKSLEQSKSKYGENSQQVKNYEKQIADLNKTIEEYKKNHDETKDSEIVNVKATSQITKSTKEINDYIKTIETLKERGINDTMLKELSGMDQKEGMALAEYWNSLDDTQLTALANNWQKYNDSLQNLGETLYSDEIDTALTEYKTKVKENLDGLPKDCVDVGVNVVKGLWNGVNETGGWLQERISSFCNSIIAKFKKSFQINSPSKVMAGLGVYITQGLGVGIISDDSAEKAIDEKVNSIINTANNSLNDTKFGIDNIIGENPMQKYQIDLNAQIGTLNDGFDRLIGLVGNYLPNISDNMNRPLMVDGNNLATSISKQMDDQLGRMAISKDRGNV